MRINLPAIVNTWVNATKVNFRIETLVVSDGEYVVHSGIELNILEPTIEVLEGIANREALQTDVAAILEELVRRNVRTGILEITIVDELLEDVLAAGEEVWR